MSTSIYKFNINNTNYLNALIETVGELPISIKDIQFPSFFNVKPETLFDGKDRIAIKELPLLIEKIKNHPDYPKKIENFELNNIKVTTATAHFLKQVIPTFQYQPVIKDPKSVGIANVIVDMVEFWTFNNTSIGYGGKTFNPKIPLTLKDAWTALHTAYSEIPSTLRAISAFPLPSENCILILLVSGDAFRLYYGNECYYKRDHSIWFDVDDGFLNAHKDKDVPLELKEAFEQWKANDRKGPVLPQPTINVELRAKAVQPKQHTHKRNYHGIMQSVVAGMVLAAGLWAYSVGLPWIVLGSVIATLFYKTAYDRLDSIACRKVHEIHNTSLIADPFSEQEMSAFWTGVKTTESNQAVLNAWKIKETYSHYSFYAAGKHLSENVDNEKKRYSITKKIS